ncbi:hypothetical protein (plasmid) [Metabacillus dongyingensis]|nr:hypothetical protein [Metabacillus dongyingensis]
MAGTIVGLRCFTIRIQKGKLQFKKQPCGCFLLLILLSIILWVF